MYIGQVAGSVVATIKHEAFAGRKLLLAHLILYRYLPWFIARWDKITAARTYLRRTALSAAAPHLT